MGRHSLAVGRKPTGTIEPTNMSPVRGGITTATSNAALPGLERWNDWWSVASRPRLENAAAPRLRTGARAPTTYTPLADHQRGNMARFIQEICLVAGCLLVAAAVGLRCWDLGRVPGVNG